MCFVELKTLTKFVAAQVCRPHMLFLCLHAGYSPSKSFGKSIEKCFVSEKKYLLKCYLKKGVKHCYCVRISVRDEASKQHYFDTFEHPCRGIPLINVEKWILTFSRDVALYRFISRMTRRSQTIKPYCKKIYYLHINGTNVQNNYYKSIHTVLSILHMIATARSLHTMTLCRRCAALKSEVRKRPFGFYGGGR